MMKKLLLIFCTLSTLTSYSQDFEMLNFINIYRAKNGCESLIHSEDLQKIAKDQNSENILFDSVSHSHKASEIALKGCSLPATKESKQNFNNFLQKFFKIDYLEPKTESEVSTYIKLYSIYLFSTSKSHNKILLGEYNYVGFDVSIKNITNKSNTIKIGDKTYKISKFINHYKANFYVVVTFKKYNI